MEERRRYIRLNSCFPVEFSLYFIPARPISEEYQGFTSNVSKGGLCVTARNLKEQDEQLILQKRVRLNLSINIPLSAKPVRATAEIVWSRKDEKDPAPKTCLIGLSYQDIKPEDRRRIFSYARRLKWMPRVAYTVVFLFFFGLVALSFYHIRLKYENEALIKRLVSVSEVKSIFEKSLNEIRVSKEMLASKFFVGREQIGSLKGKILGIEANIGSGKERLAKELDVALAEQKRLKEDLAKLSAESAITQDMARRTAEAKLTALEEKIDVLQTELAEVTKKGKSQVEIVKEELKKLQEENGLLKQQIELAKQSEVSLEEQLAQIRVRSGKLEKASVDKMLQWIRIHQAKRTGLVLSYEGDRSLQDWGFTYDQALACQAFLISGDEKRAEAILSFYAKKAKVSNGLFYNAYDVNSGSPCEYVTHSGPNIWLGISACQYTRMANDKRYLPFAEVIADIMIKMQSPQDGSISGGPDQKWVSTEHNLDAYALFNMLYELTGKGKYKQAALASLLWLRDVGYNRPDGRFERGRGDSTIATDVFSWAIAAIGPKILLDNGMSPDDIMEFAENECKVSTNFYRPDNRAIKVVGFDFAKAKNLGRGGVVSTEWTAQMVVAFKIMADYYKGLGDLEKERIYRSKAEYYLSQLGKMAICSPSPTGQGEGCLPYASIDNVDTGHGWRVAKGRRTGSVASTVYYIFAHRGYNPLSS